MGRNHLFDAMRGVAALLVVAYHLANIRVHAVPGGFLAVDFFFALSGFVVAAAYEPRLAGGMTATRFAQIRLVRLYPLVVLGTVLGLIKAVGASLTHQPLAYTPGQIATAFGFNIFVLPAPTAIRDLFPLNGPVWSLFFELIANIAFALIGWRLSRRALGAVIAISALGLVLVAWQHQTADIGWDWRTVAGGFFRVCYGFTWGHLLYRLRGQAATPRQSWWALLPVAVLSAALIVWFGGAAQVVFSLAAILVLCPSLVAVGARLELPASGHRLAAMLGDLSYPIYAIHLPLMLIFAFVLRHAHLPLAVQAVVLMLLLIAVAALAAQFYDDPVRRWLASRLAVRQSAKAQLL